MSVLRTLSSLLPLGLLLALPAHAQEDDPKVGVVASMDSHRIDRGVVESGAAAVAAVDLSGGGWHGRLETSQALRSREPGSFTLEAGHAWQFGSPALEVGLLAREHWLTGTPVGATRHDTLLGVTLGRAGEGGFRPSVTYLRDLRRRGNTLELAVAQEWPLAGLGAYLEGRVFCGWRTAARVQPDTGGPGFGDAYGYGGIGLQLPYHLPNLPRIALILGGELTGSTGRNVAWSPIGRSGGIEATGKIGVSFDF